MRRLSRRGLLGIGPLAIASCAKGSAYFGKTEAPRVQRLVYEVGGEPATLDPGKTNGGAETYIIPSLFEPLRFPHPRTSRPLAGIATHYESALNNTQFTFYLRGSYERSGTRLPGLESLRADYITGRSADDLSRGHRSPPDEQPARWSDGRPITAHDFVYSWRRVIDPATACPYAVFLYYIRNAEEINAAKRPVTDLGVVALDDYTLRVEMRSPTPFFLSLQEEPAYYAVPAHAIEPATKNGEDWTTPERMVTSGAFTLKEWRPYDHVTLVPNQHYYDAHVVSLHEVVLLPVVNGATNLNIYKAGEADSMLGKVVAPSYIPLLRSKKDFEIAPAYWSMFYAINTTQPPFDDRLVRYALNMAIDKESIAEFLRAGQSAAVGVLPPFEGYRAPSSLPVDIGGTEYDVLSHNPDAARELLGRAGVRKLQIGILYPSHPASQDVPRILRQQWRRELGAEVALHDQEQSVYIENRNALNYRGVAERGWWGDYLDPNTFLEIFLSGPSVIGTGWSDAAFDRMLAEANAAPTIAERMEKLAECERSILLAMPVLPLYYNVQTALTKPYVRGLPRGKVDSIRFKYAWIDTSWRSE